MRIDSIDLYHVALPLTRPYPPVEGRLDRLETVLVRLRSGSSEGWGEAAPGTAPLGSAEWAGGAMACLRDWLAPRLAGQAVDSASDLTDRLAAIRGNRFAKAALDMAWWDLRARLTGKSLPEALGAQRERVEAGVTFDRMDSTEVFLEAVGKAAEEGYGRIGLKFRPGWDFAMLNAVRHELPTHTLHVDCEGTMGLANMELLYRIEDFMLAMVEQPFAPEDLVAHAMAQDSLRTPVCLDESVTSPEVVEMAVDLKSARYLCVNPGRAGGLTAAVAIHDLCREHAIPCWVGATPQSAVGMRHVLALAGKENFRYPADYPPAEGWLAEDLAEAPAALRDGEESPRTVPLWTEAGIGVEPDAAILEKHTLQHARLPA